LWAVYNHKMKIRLKVNVNREDKQVIVSIVCNQCLQEAAATLSGDIATFNCPTHGSLGSSPVAQVQGNLERAQRDAEQKEGWGSPDSRPVIVAHRADKKPS
jgi:hypothetical protein